MRFAVGALVAALSTFSVESRACVCSEIPPQLLVPRPGMSHPSDAPLLVIALQGTQIFGYGPDREFQELTVREQASPFGLCAHTFMVLGRRGRVTWDEGENALSMYDDFAPPPVISTFDVTDDRLKSTSTTIQLRLERIEREPETSLGATCGDGLLDGRTIVGEIMITVELEQDDEFDAIRPLFIDAWVDDAAVGQIRDFSSNFVRFPSASEAPVTDTVPLFLPLTPDSDDCVTFSFRSWTLERATGLRTPQFCLSPGETRNEQVEVRLARAQIESELRVPPDPRLGGGCTLTRARSTLGSVFALFGAVLLWRRRRDVAACPTLES